MACVTEAADRSIAADYATTGAAWQDGPGRVYDALADVLVSGAGIDWTDRLVVEVGAGTGAGTRAIRRAGGRPLATDAADGMLRANGLDVPRLVVDARAIPLADGRADGYVAAFCLNHLSNPGQALAEARRVVRPRGPLAVSAYAADDSHPVRDAVDIALGEHGWTPPSWAHHLRDLTAPRLATVARAAAEASAAGLRRVRAEHIEVPFPQLGGDDLVEWRLGMAHTAPFVATLGDAARVRLHHRALELLGEAPTLVRRVIVLYAEA
jgi:SAM-dependent methyltransferase